MIGRTVHAVGRKPIYFKFIGGVFDEFRGAKGEIIFVNKENTVDVGRNFATEARRIHEGLAPDRAIRGEARLDEARKLLEDGIPVAPLPFIPRSKAN